MPPKLVPELLIGGRYGFCLPTKFLDLCKFGNLAREKKKGQYVKPLALLP